ncbi:pilin [Photobacterium swingsii]|uniref:pilin n=1 Tax=Photobacterium swingsii TaxID=680026 RepID=UPI0040696B21
MKKTQKGFTLIELMIVVAIIGILSAFAVPAYQNYTMKAHASEMLSATAAFKTAVGICLIEGKKDCSSGKGGVPSDQVFNKNADDNFTVAAVVTQAVAGTAVGKITSTVTKKGSLPTDAVVEITPKLSTNGVVWAVTCTGTNNSDWCPVAATPQP